SFKFSAVRNPWARTVSLYYRREGIQLRNKMSFKEFCEYHFFASDTCKMPSFHKNQYDWLIDENGVNQMDFIYKVEEYTTAIKIIREMTNGRLKLTNSIYNKNPMSKSDNYREMFDTPLKKLIAKR